MKTYMAKPGEVVQRWWLVDASDKMVGRLASDLATVLMGKHRPTYTPHVDTGDFIVVINAEKVKVTGNKGQDKMYYRHSEFPGGIKEMSFDKMIVKKPEEVIELAVKGMLPKNPLGREMFRKLKVYKGTDHPHVAQQPIVLNLDHQVQ